MCGFTGGVIIGALIVFITCIFIGIKVTNCGRKLVQIFYDKVLKKPVPEQFHLIPEQQQS